MWYLRLAIEPAAEAFADLGVILDHGRRHLDLGNQLMGD
jgi:hypothetical protein